jgi:predicted RNase H-like HicB family nuclease
MDSRGRQRHNLLMQYTVTVAHDEGEGVWFVQSSDVPGLNAEASTLDALVEVVAELAPDLIQANGGDGAPISIRVQHLLNAAPAA